MSAFGDLRAMDCICWKMDTQYDGIYVPDVSTVVDKPRVLSGFCGYFSLYSCIRNCALSFPDGTLSGILLIVHNLLISYMCKIMETLLISS